MSGTCSSIRTKLLWSFSKIVSGSRTLPPRWPSQCSCVVIESSFDPGERLQAPGSLWFTFILNSAGTDNWFHNYFTLIWYFIWIVIEKHGFIFIVILLCVLPTTVFTHLLCKLFIYLFNSTYMCICWILSIPQGSFVNKMLMGLLH